MHSVLGRIVERVGDIPPTVFFAFFLLAFVVSVVVVLLLRILTENDSLYYTETNRWQRREDDSEDVEEIPAYPHPPVHVTRFGIHRDHIRRGRESEAGCPVCYEYKTHLKREEIH